MALGVPRDSQHDPGRGQRPVSARVLRNLKAAAFVAAGVVVVAVIAVAIAVNSRTDQAPDASATSSARPTTRAVPGPLVTAAAPSASPSQTAQSDDEVTVVSGWEGVDPGALDIAVAAVWQVASQPAEESAPQRAARLGPLFAPGSPTPDDDPPAIAPDGVTLVDATPTALDWTSPYDLGDPGRLGLLVSLQVTSSGTFDGGLWQDTSTQLWRVILAPQEQGWAPAVAFPADQPEPEGDA